MINQESIEMKKRVDRIVFFAGIVVVLTFLLVAGSVSAQEEGPVLVSDGNNGNAGFDRKSTGTRS